MVLPRPREGRAALGGGLSEVRPAFQLATNSHVPPAVGANAPDAGRAAVAAVLTCSIQPFESGDLFRASSGDLCFETTSEAVRAEAHARLQRDCHLEGLYQGRSPHEEATRKLGRCTLHPWQAAVLARIMQLTQSPERMLADFRCEAPPHEVRVQCLMPQNAAVLHVGGKHVLPRGFAGKAHVLHRCRSVICMMRASTAAC